MITKQNTLYYREINQNIEIVRLFDKTQENSLSSKALSTSLISKHLNYEVIMPT